MRYTWEDDDHNRVLTFEVEGTLSPSHPAVTNHLPEDCSPGSAGELLDVSVRLYSATYYDEEGRALPGSVATMDRPTLKAIEAEFTALIWSDPDVRSAIEDLIEEHDWRMST